MADRAPVVRSTDPGRDLTPLAVLVLGLTAERPMHPYEMLQTLLSRREDRFANIRAGSLYHTVDRLTKRELLRVNEIERSGNRPERTVYAITDRGAAALADRLTALLRSPATEFPELYLGLAEAHELPVGEVIDALAVRIEAMEQERTMFATAAVQAGDRGVSEIYLLDIGCRCATLTAQIEWLGDLHDRLSDGSLPWETAADYRADAATDHPLSADDFTVHTDVSAPVETHAPVDTPAITATSTLPITREENLR